LIDAVVFDLDGTLWDTSASCAVGWNRVLERHRIAFRPITEHDVRGVTGKPHEQCIREVFAGLPETHILTLITATAHEDNEAVTELGGTVFQGVEIGLRRLSARYPLFIVSNCQTGYIEVFFKVSRLGGCFRDFECWGSTGLSKAENLRALTAIGFATRSSSVTRPAIRPPPARVAPPSCTQATASATAPTPTTASTRSPPSRAGS